MAVKALVRARPNPVPPNCRVVGGIGLLEALEQLGELLGRHADAGIAYCEA